MTIYIALAVVASQLGSDQASHLKDVVLIALIHTASPTLFLHAYI